ncbi:MAG TPA: DUF2846 domain-containing protein [Aestuariivirgaceae bacterium]|nr:DUF2846 domain-containing protein [Aestuariivirgaceae bacterium]
MASHFSRLFLVVTALLVSSCAAEGPDFKRASIQSTEVGIIYVYRPLTSVIGRGENPYVYVNGENLGQLKAGGYLEKVVPIGEYKVTVRQTVLFVPTWPESVEVAVASGGSAYVKVDQRVTGFTTEGEGATATQQVFIEEVGNEEGQIEIERAKGNS